MQFVECVDGIQRSDVFKTLALPEHLINQGPCDTLPAGSPVLSLTLIDMCFGLHFVLFALHAHTMESKVYSSVKTEVSERSSLTCRSRKVSFGVRHA